MAMKNDEQNEVCFILLCMFFFFELRLRYDETLKSLDGGFEMMLLTHFYCFDLLKASR
jgi:hypothetical protein